LGVPLRSGKLLAEIDKRLAGWKGNTIMWRRQINIG